MDVTRQSVESVRRTGLPCLEAGQQRRSSDTDESDRRQLSDETTTASVIDFRLTSRRGSVGACRSLTPVRV
jgi:hypothetical protein